MHVVTSADETVARLLAEAPDGTKAQLAREIGVTPTTVSRWAARKSRIHSRYWGDIERFFELPPGSLAEGDLSLTSLAQEVQRLEGLLVDAQRRLDELRRVLPPPQ